MCLTSRVGLLAGAATLTLAGAGWSEMNTNDDALTNRIAALEAEINALKVSNGDQWLTEQRAAEIRDLVQDVLSDADTRASLLQSGMTGGWDNGFYLGSSDGNFRLNVGGWIQTRYVYNFQDVNTGADPVDRHRNGFDIRRARLEFSGHVVNPNWMYKISGDFADENQDGVFSLRDAWIAHNCGNGFTVYAGQFKDPYMHETLVLSKHQLAVDRSVFESAFGDGRVQGIMIDWKASDNFRVRGSYNDGKNSLNGSWVTYDSEFGAFTGRVDFLAMGNWDQFEDFTSWQGDPTGVKIGGAFNYNKAEYGTTDNATPEVETWGLTADIAAEFGGANLFGAFVWQSQEDDASVDADQWGFLVQGGIFFVPNEWEVFGRFEWIDPDLDGTDEFSIITVGVNKYWAKHAVKWTTDVGWGINEVNTTNTLGANINDLGWRNDPSDEDGQFVFRTQLQLAF